MQLEDSEVYGETDAEDCPDDGGFCYSYWKTGIMASLAKWNTGKPPIITATSAYPHDDTGHGQGAWDVKAEYNRVTFSGFNSETRYG